MLAEKMQGTYAVLFVIKDSLQRYAQTGEDLRENITNGASIPLGNGRNMFSSEIFLYFKYD